MNLLVLVMKLLTIHIYELYKKQDCIIHVLNTCTCKYTPRHSGKVTDCN